MSEVKEVKCPDCGKFIRYERNCAMRWLGTFVGGAAGYGLTTKLSVTGAILGASVAAPGALLGLGIGAIIGNTTGRFIDDTTVKCLSCRRRISL